MNTHPHHGFSLLELMFTVAVLAIVLGIGVPSMVETVRSNRMTSEINNLLGVVHGARSEAVKRRTNVIVCASNNPLDATPACSGGGGTDFENGLVVFVDRNLNGQVDPNVDPALDDTVVRARGALDDSFTVNANGDYLAFASTGFRLNVPALGGDGSSVENFILCDGRGNVDLGGGRSAARGILLSTTGRPQMIRDKAEIDPFGC